MERSENEEAGGTPEISRERSPEDGMQGVAEERERMGGYGYDSPADLAEADREEKQSGSSAGR